MFLYSKILSAVGKVTYPSLLWNRNREEGCIYLTFDDGPIPLVTPWVLQTLMEYNAKATFFCIGDNVAENPDVFKMILDDGHTIGNHSHNHLNGWKTNCATYVSNVLKADLVISEIQKDRALNSEVDRKHFRPPYGRIRPSQIRELEAKNFEIVMWDVISGDYDLDRSAEKCLKDVKRFAGPGSIVVFHDSLKAFRNLQVILPEILNFYSAKGFEFKCL